MTQAETIIFDMDGTLYQLDGTANGYTNSSLHKAVTNNAISLVIEKENVNKDLASDIINDAITNRHMLSIFLGEKYLLTREQYFDRVWDIAPDDKIHRYDKTFQVISNLKSSGKTLILLTSSPNIWMNKVTSLLKLKPFFDQIYTGEMFEEKGEIFSIIGKTYDPKKTLSVGDQEHTDIAPAQKYGILGVLIRDPYELTKLVDQ